MPGDSVKFASILNKNGYTFAKNLFIDEDGNAPNVNEKGRQIEGRKPFISDKVPIGEVDPNNPGRLTDNIRDVFTEIGSAADDNYIKNLFNDKRPVEILPVPPHWSAKDAQERYGGTVGILLNPDIFNTIADMEEKCRKNGTCPDGIPDNAITIHAKVFYHTNLGSHVADRNFSIPCNDPIFPVSETTQEPSCRDSRSKMYIAWDMKDFKGRFVGTGAYVGLYDFYWRLDFPGVVMNLKMEKIERQVEMHGVKRLKKK